MRGSDVRRTGGDGRGLWAFVRSRRGNSGQRPGRNCLGWGLLVQSCREGARPARVQSAGECHEIRRGKAGRVQGAQEPESWRHNALVGVLTGNDAPMAGSAGGDDGKDASSTGASDNGTAGDGGLVSAMSARFVGMGVMVAAHLCHRVSYGVRTVKSTSGLAGFHAAIGQTRPLGPGAGVAGHQMAHMHNAVLGLDELRSPPGRHRGRSWKTPRPRQPHGAGDQPASEHVEPHTGYAGRGRGDHGPRADPTLSRQHHGTPAPRPTPRRGRGPRGTA